VLSLPPAFVLSQDQTLRLFQVVQRRKTTNGQKPSTAKQRKQTKTRNSAPSIKSVSLNALRPSGAMKMTTGKPETKTMAMNAINDKCAGNP
jgi:hypothetical protein